MTNTDVGNQRAWTRELQRHRLLHPDERLAAFFARHYPDPQAVDGAPGVDLGFGSGRHLRLLAAHGFDPHGIEVADGAVESAQAALADILDPVHLVEADLKTRPFPPSTFDVAISWGTIFLRPLAAMVTDLQIVRTMLRDGGRLVVNFRAPESWFFGLGTQLHDSTFQLDERAGSYEGTCYTFLDRQPAEDLVRSTGFVPTDVERVELWKGDARERHAWWVFHLVAA